MQEHLRAGPATGEVCPTLAEDLLRGADAIALFVFGDAKERRKVYYYASEAKVRMFAYLSGAEGPQVESRSGWDVDGVEIRVILDFGAGFIDHRGWFMNAGA